MANTPAPPQPPSNPLRELLAFLGQNKKWWLMPILLVFLLVAGILVCKLAMFFASSHSVVHRI